LYSQTEKNSPVVWREMLATQAGRLRAVIEQAVDALEKAQPFETVTRPAPLSWQT
jgi:hypothetical protein